MSWQVEWLEEAAKDMRRLGKAEQKQVLKGIAKVSENPLPSSQGGYGKPLRNANRAHLAGLCKIKFRDWNQSGIQAGSQGRNHGHHRRRRQNGWRSLPEGR